MGKTMCKESKSDSDKQKEGKFECKKCGAVASKEKKLCKPKKIK